MKQRHQIIVKEIQQRKNLFEIFSDHFPVSAHIFLTQNNSYYECKSDSTCQTDAAVDLSSEMEKATPFPECRIYFCQMITDTEDFNYINMDRNKGKSIIVRGHFSGEQVL